VLARVEEQAVHLPQTKKSVAAQEVGQAVRLLRAACHRGLALLDGGIDRADVRQALANEMNALMDEHARVWRLRNREGGLADSQAAMQLVCDEYV